MKIIFLCSTLERTGPTNQLFNIIANLDTSLYEPLVVTLSLEGDKSFLDKFLSRGMQVESLRLPHNFSKRRLLHELNTLLIKYKPSIVHSQGIRSDYLMSRVNYPVKKIATLRNVPYLDYPMAYGWLKGRVMSFVHLNALKKIDQAVTVSYGVQQELNNTFSGNLKVVHNGVDHNFFDPLLISTMQLNSLRTKLKINTNEIVLVYTGILESRKQLDTLYNIMLDVADVRLLVVGGGTLEETLQNHNAVKSGKVTMLGTVDDVRPFLALASGFISISSAEGLPNSMIEAMMMGLPVIASDIAPHAELVIGEDVPIKLFSLNEPEALTAFISKQLSDWLIKKQLFNVREYTINNFSAQAMSNNYQTLYRELFNG
jgi:glycosyltransferase involved in cell wall biosynthesis